MSVVAELCVPDLGQGFEAELSDLEEHTDVSTPMQDHPRPSFTPVLKERHLSVSTSNALDNFEYLESLLVGKRLVLLLDYDGTLTPIVNDPSKALLSEQVRNILRELPKHYVTGVVSGRSLEKIKTFVAVPGIFYAGSHGFDILAPPGSCADQASQSLPGRLENVRLTNPPVDAEGHDLTVATELAPAPASKESDAALGGPAGGGKGCGCAPNAAGEGLNRGVHYQVAGEFLPALAEIKREVEEALQGIEGAQVEDNIFSISVHYRNCPRSCLPRVTEIVQAARARHECIRMRTGKEVYELQPDIKWDKGSAVQWLLAMLGLQGGGDEGDQQDPEVPPPPGDPAGSDSPPRREGEDVGGDVFTIFIGDDKTDEDAFRVFVGEGRPHTGLGILVSEESRETNAAYSLRNPHEVAIFLQKLVAIGRAHNLQPLTVCYPPVENGMGGSDSDTKMVNMAKTLGLKRVSSSRNTSLAPAFQTPSQSA